MLFDLDEVGLQPEDETFTSKAAGHHRSVHVHGHGVDDRGRRTSNAEFSYSLDLPASLRFNLARGIVKHEFKSSFLSEGFHNSS